MCASLLLALMRHWSIFGTVFSFFIPLLNTVKVTKAVYLCLDIVKRSRGILLKSRVLWNTSHKRCGHCVLFGVVTEVNREHKHSTQLLNPEYLNIFKLNIKRYANAGLY